MVTRWWRSTLDGRGSVPPKYAVSQTLGFIKGKSAIHQRMIDSNTLGALNLSSNW